MALRNAAAGATRAATMVHRKVVMAAKVVTAPKEIMVVVPVLRKAETTAASTVTRADRATILTATIPRAATVRKADKAVTARDSATRVATAHKAECHAVALTTKKWVPEEDHRKAATAAALLTTTSLRTWADHKATATILPAETSTMTTTAHLLPAADATTTTIINRYRF